jgi:hypothetical protein
MENMEEKGPLEQEQVAEPTDLEAKVESLQNLVVSVLILGIVISGTLNIFLLRQWRFSKADLANIGPRAAQVISDYQKGDGPKMDEFIKKITDFGRTHPDFVPVLTKYGIKPVSAPATGAPSTPAPAPGTTSKP